MNLQLLADQLRQHPKSDDLVARYLDCHQEECGYGLCHAVRSAAAIIESALRAHHLAEATHLMREGSEYRDLIQAMLIEECEIPQASTVTILLIEGDQSPATRTRSRLKNGVRRGYTTITVGADYVLSCKEEVDDWKTREKQSQYEWAGFERD